MLRKVTMVAGVAGTMLVASALPAMAGGPWGSADCKQTPTPACQLGAGNGGTDPAPGGKIPGSGNRPGRPGGGQGGNQQQTGDRGMGPPDKTVNCSYEKSSYQPPAGGTVTIAYRPPPTDKTALAQPAIFQRADARVAANFAAAPPGKGPGAWYIYKCSGSGFGDGMYHAPVWLPDGHQPPGAAPLPSPAELAQMARSQLKLPSPEIAANPRGDQLVSLPTWLWLSSGWDQQSATAAVPGVSVTAVARPTSLEWAMGDGSTVNCKNGGTPFPAGGDPKAASPDCGHTYRASSAGKPNNAYPVAATVHWSISWSGAGQSGTFPDMTTTANAAFRVAESQALNTGGG